jgi:hypothetical protein
MTSVRDLFDDPKKLLTQDDWYILRTIISPKPSHVMCCMCLDDWVELPGRACEACIFERMRARD